MSLESKFKINPKIKILHENIEFSFKELVNHFLKPYNAVK